MALTEEKPQIWRHIAQLASLNLLLALNIIDALRRDDPVERVAATLLNLATHTPLNPSMINVSQTDLGAIARLSRSTVNRALAELTREGWVRLQYGAIEIVDVGGLAGFVWAEQE
jgi:CRP-like cAMP-binding protein